MTASLTPVSQLLPIIPALPPSLQRVPSWLDEPPGTPVGAGAWRDAWPVWAENLKDFRVWAAKQAVTNTAFRQAQMDACAEDVAYFLAVYGWIFEPRDTDLGPPDWYQWCLFPHQVIALRQFEEAWASKKPRSDVVWEKSRDMGATWLAMGICLHQWLFASHAFSAGLASYKEEAVDDGSPDSMFFKLRGLLGVLEYGDVPGVPVWMRPDGYIPQVHGRMRKLFHPTKNRTVKGEATTIRTGTGYRNTVRVNDEGAKHELLDEVLSTIRASTNHILTLSSAYRKFGDDFMLLAEKARNAEDALLTPGGPQGPRYYRMEWWMHPFHDDAWLAAEEAGYATPEDFAREVLIDYRAGETNFIYSEEASKVPLVETWDDPETDLMIGIDPGLKDDWAMVFTNVWGDPYDPNVRWIDSYENNNKATEYFAYLLAGVEPDPEDFCAQLYAFGENELRIIAWMRRVWFSNRPVIAVMDPAGAQRTLGSVTPDRTQGRSPKEILEEHVEFLQQRELDRLIAAGEDPRKLPPVRGIDIEYRHLYSATRHDPRRTNLRRVMAKSEVSKTRGGLRILTCWKEGRFQERTREAVTDPKPIHDQYSHINAGSEYLASHILSAGRPGGSAATNRVQPGKRTIAPERRRVAA